MASWTRNLTRRSTPAARVGFGLLIKLASISTPTPRAELCAAAMRCGRSAPKSHTLTRTDLREAQHAIDDVRKASPRTGKALAFPQAATGSRGGPEHSHKQSVDPPTVVHRRIVLSMRHRRASLK